MSLMSHTESDSAFVRLRARILADFRDTRFSWAGFLRWTGITLLAVIAAALIVLYFLDWNEMRGPISRYASARSGREVRIDGDLKVNLFRWQPHVEVGGLYIGNPGWVGRGDGTSIANAVVEFRLVPALFGQLKLPLVALYRPDILVVRDAQGRSNWDSDPKGAAAAWAIPPINRFLVRDGRLEIDDAVRKLKFVGTISSEEVAGAKGASAFQLKGEGLLNSNKFLAEVHGGPLINVDVNKPYAFDANISAGDTRAVLSGRITHPFNLGQLTATVDFSGKSLSELYDLTGLALPRTPSYRITTKLTRDESLYMLNGLSGVLGKSDIQGDLTVDVTGSKPDLTGILKSSVLNFSDLGELIGGGKSHPVEAQYLLPDTPLHVERLNQMDADIFYNADAINSQDIPLRGLSTHIVLKNGVMNLKPLSFAFPQGKLTGSLKIDARDPQLPVTSVDARLTGIEIANFIKGAEKPVSGKVEARAVLTGKGNSVHKVGATANGTFSTVIPSGQIRESLANWMGINVLNALLLSGSDANSRVRCAVAHFGAKDGILTTQQFVFDTEPVLVQGAGVINLGRELIDMRVQGKPKSFQIFRLRAPITVTGALAHPDLGVGTGAIITQGAIGAGLGAINPLAAILAFIDPGLADDANCGALLSTARAPGAAAKGK